MIISFKANQQQHETRKTNSHYVFFFPLCGRATKRAKRVSFYPNLFTQFWIWNQESNWCTISLRWRPTAPQKKTHSQSEWSFLIQNCLDRCVVCSISHLAIKNPSTCGASNYSVLDSDSIDLKHKYLARHDNALHPTLGSKKEIIRISFRIN
jgi:hypothetical protein